MSYNLVILPPLDDQALAQMHAVRSQLDAYPYDFDGVKSPPTLADFECPHGALATDAAVRCDCFATWSK